MTKIAVLIVFSFINLVFAPSAFSYDSKHRKSVFESQPKCGNFVRFDDKNLYLGFGPYLLGLSKDREPIPGKLQIVPLDGSDPVNLTAQDSVVDTVSDGDSLYALTYTGLEEWSLSKKSRIATYPTYILNRNMEYKEHAEGMVRYKNWLVIAHGRLGVSIFDIETKRILNQIRLVKRQLPWESMATAVTVSGDNAWIVMDNFTLVDPSKGSAFRGLVQLHLPTQSVQREIPGLDPGADAIVNDGKSWIVSYMGRPLWKFSKSELNNKVLSVLPQNQFWSFPEKGHPTGLPTLDDEFYYTCYQVPPKSPSDKGMYRRVPVALNRSQMML